MILTLALLAGLFAAWLLIGVVEKFRLGLRFTQALLYVPFKLAYRIADDRIRIARKASVPVIYVISHQSRFEPALMLSLLPEDTLHILDDASARSPWLEPWRELGRTIAFNAEHVFVSRRLVRVLKGKGRLAVYLPDAVEPDVKTFRLFRAVTRIAMQADARIVPIFVAGARILPVSLTPADKAPRRWFPRLSISVLEPMTIAELVARNPDQASNTNALFDRVAEARLFGSDLDRGLFLAMRDAADRVGASHPIIEDVISGALSYRKLFIGARVLGRRFEAVTAPGEAVGLLLPNANGVVLSLVGLLVGRPGGGDDQLYRRPGQRHRRRAHGGDPHRGLVARLCREGRPRRHRRGGREGRRQAAMAGGCARPASPCWTSSPPPCCGAGRCSRRTQPSRR